MIEEHPDWKTTDEVLDEEISSEQCTARCKNILKWEGIRTYRDLANRKKRDMLRIPNVGRKTVRELEEMLQARGLEFGLDLTTVGVGDPLRESVANLNKMIRDIDSQTSRLVRAQQGLKDAVARISASIKGEVSRDRREEIEREIVADRLRGGTLDVIAEKHGVSLDYVSRVLVWKAGQLGLGGKPNGDV